MKIKFFGVDLEIIEYCGVVSEVIVEVMVLGVKERLGIDWGIVIIGIVGFGGGMEEKFIGIVYVGLVDFYG